MEKSVEVWKPIIGFEGSYEVSNLGRVKSLEKIVENGINITEWKRTRKYCIQ